MTTTTNADMPDLDTLRSKIKDDRPIRFQRYGFHTHAGTMGKVTWSEPVPSLAETWTFGRLLNRHDYDLEDNTSPGQRDISEAHIRKIAEGLRHTPRPYIGALTIALAREHVEVETIDQVGSGVELVRITVREGAPDAWVVDGQHREMALARVWPQVKDAQEGDEADVRRHLEHSSVEMTLLLEGDPDVLSTIFVNMASTKPISASLIAVMDKENVQNRLGQYVIRRAQLLRNRVTYLSRTAHKERAEEPFEALYPAAAVRSAAAAIAGVGVRDRSPDQRESILRDVLAERAATTTSHGDQAMQALGDDIVELLDYAYEVIPGWREIAEGKLSVADFRSQYLHSSAAGLHVIANVIAAAQAAEVSPQRAIDALAELPWERTALREIDGPNGERAMAHHFFEGSLAKTAWDPRKNEWRAGAAGATRSGYETAIDTVLRHIANKDQTLAALAERETYVKIGLVAEKRGPGRPRKVQPPTS